MTFDILISIKLTFGGNACFPDLCKHELVELGQILPTSSILACDLRRFYSMKMYRSEGFPEQDIWPLHVMDQGSCQIGRVLGTSSPSSSPPPPSPGSSGWHSGRETIFGVFKLDFDSYEGYLDFETGLLPRISSRIYLASRVVWPEELFCKTC